MTPFTKVAKAAALIDRAGSPAATMKQASGRCRTRDNELADVVVLDRTGDVGHDVDQAGEPQVEVLADMACLEREGGPWCWPTKRSAAHTNRMARVSGGRSRLSQDTAGSGIGRLQDDRGGGGGERPRQLVVVVPIFDDRQGSPIGLPRVVETSETVASGCGVDAREHEIFPARKRPEPRGGLRAHPYRKEDLVDMGRAS